MSWPNLPRQGSAEKQKQQLWGNFWRGLIEFAGVNHARSSGMTAGLRHQPEISRYGELLPMRLQAPRRRLIAATGASNALIRRLANGRARGCALQWQGAR